MGRKERKEFQLVFLSLTHAHTGPSRSLGCLTCVRCPSPPCHTHTSAPARSHRHKLTTSQALPELRARACLRAGGCWLLPWRSLHLLPSKHDLLTPTPGQILCLKSSWHSVLPPLNKFCSITAFPWLAEKSGQRNIRNSCPKDLVGWIYMRHESSLSGALPSLAS